MIKNVLIPEKIGNYYIFSKRVVGFYVDASHVTATKLYLNGSKAKIENVFKKSIGVDQELSYEEKVGQVIKDILKQAGKYDSVFTAMPSSQVIFKNLRLPFLNYEKIKMVVGYEVEPLLPFALDEAVVDFVITKQFPEEGSSEIIVAAAQKSSIAEHLSFFEQFGVSPEKIGVDLFALYGLYQRVPAYQEISGGAALVDIGLNTTRVAFMEDGQLSAVRVLSKGVEDFVTAVSRACSLSKEDARNTIDAFGLTKQDDPTYYKAIVDALTSFWSSVQFTINSFSGKKDEQPVSRFILSGAGVQIAGLNDFVSDHSHVPCEHFQTTPLLFDKKLKVKDKQMLSAANLTSLGVCLPADVTEQFNLLPVHMSVDRDMSVLTRQLIIGCFFVLSIFGLLIANSFLQIGKLQRELTESKQEVVSILKSRFEIPEEDQDFDDVVESAERAVTNEESVWSPFLAQSQFLKYLLELFSLDREGLGLEVERVSIAKGVMTLKAKVKDHAALSQLEKELSRSDLFKYRDSLQETDFTMKIPLARNG
ncbi:pilus assembly protein PilM [Candidatus Dependentiae bacterium]